MMVWRISFLRVYGGPNKTLFETRRSKNSRIISGKCGITVTTVGYPNHFVDINQDGFLDIYCSGWRKSNGPTIMCY